MTDIFFEDIEVGWQATSGEYAVEAEEMLEFSKKWDPMPIHIDAQAGEAIHGGLIGSGQYTLCIKQILITHLGFDDAVIGAIGFDELRFVNPVRPGQHLKLQAQCIERRESKSKPDRGVVKLNVEIADRGGTVVLRYIDIVMMRKRPT